MSEKTKVTKATAIKQEPYRLTDLKHALNAILAYMAR
jgi:hypothetical protein